MVLARVELGDVDIDEADVRVLEGRFRCGGKVRVARADANYQIGVMRQAVSRQRAGCSDRPGVERVVEAQTALARHRLPYRDAGGIDQRSQRFCRLGVDHTAARHD